MHLTLDRDSPVGPNEQLRQQLRTLIVGGLLEPGDRLPSVRQLAGDLQLANATVAKLYRDLERDGLVSTGGRGTYVRDLGNDAESYRVDALSAAASEFARAVRLLGVDPSQGVNAFEAAYEASTNPASAHE